MTTYQWLCLLGIPSIISVLGGMIIAQWKQIKAIREGIRALLRDRLLQGYKFYQDRGWAEYEDRANMENVYEQYRSLGGNGAMTDMHRVFKMLPGKQECLKTETASGAAEAPPAPETVKRKTQRTESNKGGKRK